MSISNHKDTKIHQGVIPTRLKEISTDTLQTSTEGAREISISIYIKHTAFYIQTRGTSFLKEKVFTASLQYWIILDWNQGAHVNAAFITRSYPIQFVIAPHSSCNQIEIRNQSTRRSFTIFFQNTDPLISFLSDIPKTLKICCYYYSSAPSSLLHHNMSNHQKERFQFGMRRIQKHCNTKRT